MNKVRESEDGYEKLQQGNKASVKGGRTKVMEKQRKREKERERERESWTLVTGK